jgi:hypothetical protein
MSVMRKRMRYCKYARTLKSTVCIYMKMKFFDFFKFLVLTRIVITSYYVINTINKKT